MIVGLLLAAYLWVAVRVSVYLHAEPGRCSLTVSAVAGALWPLTVLMGFCLLMRGEGE